MRVDGGEGDAKLLGEFGRRRDAAWGAGIRQQNSSLMGRKTLIHRFQYFGPNVRSVRGSVFDGDVRVRVRQGLLPIVVGRRRAIAVFVPRRAKLVERQVVGNRPEPALERAFSRIERRAALPGMLDGRDGDLVSRVLRQ
ncbi:MAG TPA: hypothetical protein VNH11_21425 [Pirellulales bacterium]|nr:hypothetical protein [Pirellulales bacterium]